MQKLFWGFHLFLTFTCFHLKAQDKYDVSVLTCSQGKELFSVFGHSALRVINHTTGEDVVYDYGVFSFDTPDFYSKFLKGDLTYRLAKRDFSIFLNTYQIENRTVWEQQLVLSDASKKQLVARLEENFKPENRSYQYRFLEDNCSTRIIENLEKLDDIQLKFSRKEENLSYRECLQTYLKGTPWIELGINLLIGEKGDEKAGKREQMFLPDFLLVNIENSSILDSSGKRSDLSIESLKIVESIQGINKINKGVTPIELFLVLMILTSLMTLFLTENVQIDFWISVLFAVLGVFFFLIWVRTTHEILSWNWNIVWANPLYLFFLPLMSRKNYLKMVFIFNGMFLITFPFFPQQIPMFCVLMSGLLQFLMAIRAIDKGFNSKI